MTTREPNDDVQQLHDAEEELRAVRCQGAEMTPLLDKLDKYAKENAFAERLVAALELNLRRRA
jgi:hypothetical protein